MLLKGARKMSKRCFQGFHGNGPRLYPNSLPMPPVMPPIRGIFPAGFWAEELFLEMDST